MGTDAQLNKIKTFLPSVKNDAPPPESPADALYRILYLSPDQKRDKTKMRRHPLLDQAAQKKANDMAANNYFAHTSPSGVTANQNVLSVGYPLPKGYSPDTNNVESIYMGGSSIDYAAMAAEAWFNSSHHRPHVYGEGDFFGNQNCIGVAMAPFTKSEEAYRGYWVFISCPCPD